MNMGLCKYYLSISNAGLVMPDATFVKEQSALTLDFEHPTTACQAAKMRNPLACASWLLTTCCRNISARNGPFVSGEARCSKVNVNPAAFRGNLVAIWVS
jgi:hypothetical protein